MRLRTWRRSVMAAGLAATCAIGANAQSARGTDAATDTQRLVPAEIIDARGFAQPMIAGRLQIPAGWRVTGGVDWIDSGPCSPLQVQVLWTASAPDGHSVIALLPGVPIRTARDPPAREGTFGRQIEVPTARAFLEQHARQLRVGARVIDHQDQPRAAWEYQRQARAALGPAAAAPAPDARTEAGRILLAYRHGGIEMREEMTAVVSLVGLSGWADRVAAYRAPQNRFDADLLARVLASAAPDPQWEAAASARIRAHTERGNASQCSAPPGQPPRAGPGAPVLRVAAPRAAAPERFAPAPDCPALDRLRANPPPWDGPMQQCMAGIQPIQSQPYVGAQRDYAGRSMACHLAWVARYEGPLWGGACATSR